MKLIVVAIVVCAFVSSSSAAISYGTSRPFGCRFEDDCRVVRCGSGIKRDSRGCALRGCPCEEGFTPPDLSCVCVRAPCPCPISCPRLTCPVDCAARNGWVRDAAGCNTCECKPKTVCLPRPCARRCENGVVSDENGCPTCECRCGPVCKIFCEFGNVEDEFGCPTCRCNPDPNPQWGRWSSWSSCSGTCGAGTQSKTRECSDPSGDGELCPGSGREIRACINERSCHVCPHRSCSPIHRCFNGFNKDSNGCDLCSCKPHISTVKPGTCPQLRFNSSRMRGHSQNGCRRDSQCPGRQKCCSVRSFVMVCVEPSHPHVAGPY